MTGGNRTVQRILVVKLADLGDLLLSEPALRSLRQGFPSTRIDLLVQPGAEELAGWIAPGLNVVRFPKSEFDDLPRLADPRNLAAGAGLALRLRRARYHAVVLLHHLTTPMGARKLRSLALAAGSPIVAGLDNGRGGFLSRPVSDLGFGAVHEADYALSVARSAGGAEVDPRPRISVQPARLPVELPERFVVIYPATGAYAPARTWPAASFADVARRLVEQDLGIVIVGAADAQPAAAVIRAAVPTAVDLTGRTNLAELGGVVSRALAVVGGDSLVGHLASALDRPLVAVFGPSNAGAWRPYGSAIVEVGQELPDARAIALTSGMPCAPCLYTGFTLGRRDGCPARTCLSLITPERVVAALDVVMAADKA